MQAITVSSTGVDKFVLVKRLALKIIFSKSESTVSFSPSYGIYPQEKRYSDSDNDKTFAAQFNTKLINQPKADDAKMDDDSDHI